MKIFFCIWESKRNRQELTSPDCTTKSTEHKIRRRKIETNEEEEKNINDETRQFPMGENFKLNRLKIMTGWDRNGRNYSNERWRRRREKRVKDKRNFIQLSVGRKPKMCTRTDNNGRHVSHDCRKGFIPFIFKLLPGPKFLRHSKRVCPAVHLPLDHLFRSMPFAIRSHPIK